MLRRIQLGAAANKTAPWKIAFASVVGVPQTAGLASLSSLPIPCGLRALRAVQGSATPATPTLVARRSFMGGVFGAKQRNVKVDNVAFDKETPHYRGTIFGLPADDVVFYSKVLAGAFTVLVVMYIFLKGCAVLTRFSMQTVARLGFFGGFFSCMILYTMMVQLVRHSQINANAVYNQSIALVMQREKVQQFLGTHPRTGEFKTYSASGGFKLPLLRRIRSGTYELSDLLGLKPRRLQMLFLLKNPATNHEGIVACDVRREMTGFLSSTNVYKSLSITLYDKNNKSNPETIILIGRPEDVVYHTLLR